jgi:hypothetical protein
MPQINLQKFIPKTTPELKSQSDTKPQEQSNISSPEIVPVQSVRDVESRIVSEQSSQNPLPIQSTATSAKDTIASTPVNEFNPVTFELRQKVGELSKAMLDRHPSMPSLLRDIHRTLRQYPEQVTILEPEELNKIVEGLVVQTGISFATSASSKTAANKSLTNKIKTMGTGAF